MPRDDLEFSISQYADGTLAGADRAALEALLDKDSTARAMLAEHRELTDLLRAAPAPEVDWDGLAGAISSAIDVRGMRIDDQPSWRLGWRMPAVLALAASVLLAVGLAVHLLVRGGSTSPTVPPVPSSVAIVKVDVSAADQPEGPPVADVAIGPGGQYAKEPSLAPYADDIDSRPSRVIIASGINPDTSAKPLFPD